MNFAGAARSSRQAILEAVLNDTADLSTEVRSFRFAKRGGFRVRLDKQFVAQYLPVVQCENTVGVFRERAVVSHQYKRRSLFAV